MDRRTCRDLRGHHPWRFFGEQFPGWAVEFTDELPIGKAGLTVHAEHKVLLAVGLNQADRRSTLAHETGHVLRGPHSECDQPREEALVEKQAARLLMPSVHRVGHALTFHRADHERAADELWVDEKLLNVRLHTLGPWEQTYLDEQRALILL